MDLFNKINVYLNTLLNDILLFDNIFFSISYFIHTVGILNVYTINNFMYVFVN